jgi:hypothetical protein
MPELSEIVRQDAPGPTCVSVNVFSGRVIALATGADEDTAKAAAQRVAQDARRQPVQDDKARACPANCVQTASASSPRLYGEALLSVCADADTPVWVAYHWAGWRATVDCRNQPLYANLAATVSFKTLEHLPATVCPGTRTLSGCVVAMAIAGNQTDADRAAKAKAKEIADGRITAQRQTQCPAGCAPQLAGDVASTPVKLEPHHEIPQARQGGGANGAKRVVSYYAAAWQVEIRCVQADDGDDDEEGEGEMYTPRGRGEREGR